MRYSKEVLKRFKTPLKFIGEMDVSRTDVGCGSVGSPACGDIMKLFILIRKGVVKDVKIKIFGCASAFAASIRLAEICMNKNIDQLLKITNSEIATHLSLSKIKMHCSTLAEEALGMALYDYHKKNNLEFSVKEHIDFHNHKKTDSNNEKIKLTDKALEILKEISKIGKILKIEVEKGSCGIRYSYKLIESTFDNIVSIEISNINVAYDEKDYKYIAGLIIDYEKHGLDQRLVFSNELSQGTCACKASISF